MNLESLMEFINASSLDADVKEVLVDRLEAEGLTTATIDVLKEAFQDKIDELFDAAGVQLDPNDPESQKMLKEYQDSLAQLQKEGEAEAADLKASLTQDMSALQSRADNAQADQIRKDFP